MSFKPAKYVTPHARLIGPLATHHRVTAVINEAFPIRFEVNRFQSSTIAEMMEWLRERHGDHAMVKVGDPNHDYPAIWIDPDSHWVFSGMNFSLYFRDAKYALEWKLRWF